LGDLPLFVLTRGVSSPLKGQDREDYQRVTAAWFSMHERYARMSTAGVHRVVPGAAHEIQNDRPDVLGATIAEAIWHSRGTRDNTLSGPSIDR